MRQRERRPGLSELRPRWGRTPVNSPRRGHFAVACHATAIAAKSSLYPAQSCKVAGSKLAPLGQTRVCASQSIRT